MGSPLLLDSAQVEGNRFLIDTAYNLYPVTTRPFEIREVHPLGGLSELLLTEPN